MLLSVEVYVAFSEFLFFFITIDELSKLHIPLYVIMFYDTFEECDTRFRNEIFSCNVFQDETRCAAWGAGAIRASDNVFIPNNVAW